MVEMTLVVQNATGLHARPATDLVKLCQQFESDVIIYKEDDEINAKSIVSVLAGGVMQGDEIRMEISGPDEQEAGKAVFDYISQLTDEAKVETGQEGLY